VCLALLSLCAVVGVVSEADSQPGHPGSVLANALVTVGLVGLVVLLIGSGLVGVVLALAGGTGRPRPAARFCAGCGQAAGDSADCVRCGRPLHRLAAAAQRPDA
jgi:hypothetical protein